MKNKRLIIAPLLVVALAITAFLVLRDKDDDSTRIVASGTVESTEADLGFQLGGRVAQVNVREGDVVQPGVVLARLDQAELDARKAAALAQAAAARALLAELQHGARPEEVRQTQSGVVAAQRRMEESASILARTRKLYEGGAVSRESLDQAETAHTVARTQYQQARDQLTLVNDGPRSERIAAQRAVLQQAEAAVAQVQANMDNAVIPHPSQAW